MTHLSEHFTLEELTRSDAEALGVDNTPNATHIAQLQQLCRKVLEPLRAKFREPIMVTSGYRSQALNEAKKRYYLSRHSLGQAVDIRFLEDARRPLEQSREWLLAGTIANELDFDGMILEFPPGRTPWVHVSHDYVAANRGELRGKFDYYNGGPYIAVRRAAAQDWVEACRALQCSH